MQAEHIFKDPHRYPELADPLLEGKFPPKALNQAVAVAAMCLNEEASARPLMSDVVSALTFLGTDPSEIDFIDNNDNNNNNTSSSSNSNNNEQQVQQEQDSIWIFFDDDDDDTAFLNQQAAVAAAVEANR